MIVFDLDGTLADPEHRRHFVDPNYLDKAYWKIKSRIGDGCDAYELRTGGIWKPDYKSFYEACDGDIPIDPAIRMFNALVLLDNTIEIWSGRCESVKEKTLEWLAEHTCFNPEYPLRLRMRPIGDSTPDDVLKERWLDEAIAEGKTIEFVFDDRPKVVKMWRRRGIFVFNCLQHDREF